MASRKLKITLIALVFLVGGITIYLLYNSKPYAHIRRAEATYILSAGNLIADYDKDEALANKKYSESIIEVSGRISEIKKVMEYHVISLYGNETESGIICHMLPEENSKVTRLQKEQQITLKGVCTGYLIDVMMIKCILKD
ncbi:hypothetical protein GWK08_08370 [Leptobacterium flavescens]|uniref:tRNA_anti-like n=1 Tax=Leptobacterium flavescens TaxID=472055 RepID=A0A6P0UKF8_9FLAO|nr:hypothetical protein [Leptobacterium flavescens]NER13447.1 hypothetical protein [Leptobacterium flavescens]